MTAHKKAKLFMQYAEKAQVSETPWEYFEWLDRYGNYRQFSGASDVILADVDLTVRLKPTTMQLTEEHQNEVSKLANHIQQLEAENTKLWSEQHEGQRVYRRLLAELEEQRVINEELRNTRGDV